MSAPAPTDDPPALTRADDERAAVDAFSVDGRYRRDAEGVLAALRDPRVAAAIYAIIRDAQRRGLPLLMPPVPAPAQQHAAGPLPHEELPPSPFEQLEKLLLRSIHTPDIWAAARTRIFTELCGLSDKEEKRLGRRS